ncbi:hypothetical protein GCM10008107_26590 [Psychrosphaera saromensis]|nr:hypothetical protein [Psychrosphaera saromensis]GHB75852.1 hypothetical protein GCM10008107_26590 [Psychrosphaera saromensis]GLQ14538.1 hypothetical protein GCM10007917_19930 [Psychrosphaera saromensis]
MRLLNRKLRMAVVFLISFISNETLANCDLDNMAELSSIEIQNCSVKLIGKRDLYIDWMLRAKQLGSNYALFNMYKNSIFKLTEKEKGEFLNLAAQNCYFPAITEMFYLAKQKKSNDVELWATLVALNTVKGSVNFKEAKKVLINKPNISSIALLSFLSRFECIDTFENMRRK